jgi:putative inorganic carbon (HCO3(-)) transporter
MPVDAIPIGRMGILLPCASIGFLVFYLITPSTMLAGAVLLFVGLLALSLRWPEIGTLVVLFSIYSNISVLAMRSPAAIAATAGSPDRNPRIIVVLGALSLFLAIPLLYQLFVRKEKLIFDRGFILMLAYLTVGLASSFFVRDQRTLISEIGDFLVEGLVLYFLLTNVIWDFSVLRRAIWALLVAGSLMAGFSIYQRATHTQTNIYGGFAQVDLGPKVQENEKERMERLRASGKIDSEGEIAGNSRAGGPIGGSNEYAQILLILLPLAVLQFRTESSRALRALALVSAGFISGGLILTFSRGCLLAAMVVFVMMTWTGLLKLRHALVSVLVVGLLIIILAPTVVTRMATLGRLKGLFSRSVAADQAPDSSAVLRYALDVALWHVFLDHPILGVGPGQFAKHYSITYVNRLGILEQRKNYMAHNLYLETLAEGGLIGAACFFSILAVIMYRLWKARSRFQQRRPDLAFGASALFLSLSGYAISSLFAHLAYQRYFWLLLALSSAAIRLIHRSSEQEVMDDLPVLGNLVPRNKMLRLNAEDAYSK